MDEAKQQPAAPLRFGSHIVGMAILALASPYVWYGSERTLTWFSTWITPLVIAAVAFGLYALFFAKRAKAAWPDRYFMLAWVILALAVASPYFEAFNNRQGSAEPHTTPSIADTSPATASQPPIASDEGPWTKYQK